MTDSMSVCTFSTFQKETCLKTIHFGRVLVETVAIEWKFCRFPYLDSAIFRPAKIQLVLVG